MPTPNNDITAIQNYAGDYAPDIVEQVFQNLDIALDNDLRTNVREPLILPKYTANDGLRPYNSAVTQPKGQAGAFSQRTLTPRTSMKLLNIVPQELRGTYLGRGVAANQRDYPKGFAQYFWSAQSKKLADEINRNSYLSIDPSTLSPFNAGTAYTTGQRVSFGDDYVQAAANTTAGQTPISHPNLWLDINNKCLGAGYGTILSLEFAALPAANKIATGAITDTNAFDKIVAMYQAMPPEKQALGGEFKVSYNVWQKYMNSLLTKFTAGTSFMEVKGDRPAMYVFGSGNQWVIKPCTWLGASQRILATQKSNLVIGTDTLSDAEVIGNMVPHIHGYYCKFQLILAFQFVDLDLLYVNDQA